MADKNVLNEEVENLEDDGRVEIKWKRFYF